MKKSAVTSIIAAIVISGTATVAHASGYDPVAPDRYSTMFPAYDHTSSTEYTIRPAGSENQGFRPFAANRYTSSSDIHSKQEQTAAIGDGGNSFSPFAADRYTR